MIAAFFFTQLTRKIDFTLVYRYMMQRELKKFHTKYPTYYDKEEQKQITLDSTKNQTIS